MDSRYVEILTRYSLDRGAAGRLVSRRRCLELGAAARASLRHFDMSTLLTLMSHLQNYPTFIAAVAIGNLARLPASVMNKFVTFYLLSRVVYNASSFLTSRVLWVLR